ncbi:hypothetical protein R1sor_000392 [Riccia sorocarpa]|uniref:allene-oxide cyclase n=1 Tax=Riccia sorocarpa TaxID=122646 RepID=A0ABD3GW35_9MARC
MATASSALAIGSGLAGKAVSKQSLRNSQSSPTVSLPAAPLKSQFFGVSHVSRSLRRSSSPGSEVRSSSSAAIVSASFVEKLGKLFSKDEKNDEEQVMALFEFNEGDKGSPFLVKNNKTSQAPCIGDLVPYSNKVYDCTGKKYLGRSAGLCVVVEHHFPSGGDLFETTMSHYVGDYGHLSCQGPYMSYADSEMAVTGGTGIFAGARGWVKCQNIAGPLKLIYTYHLKGIAKLPADLCQPPVLPGQVKKEVKQPVLAQASKS